MEKEVGKRVTEDRKTDEALKTITRIRTVRMEVKKTLHDSVLICTNFNIQM